MSAVKIHAQQIEMVPVSALKGYDKNARKHSPKQINVLANIMRDSGFTAPLLIDDEGVIIGGHGRLAAAKKLKMELVPCVRVRDISQEQIKAMRLSDNSIGLASEWDDALLKIELADLQGVGFDLSLTGFSSPELSNLFATAKGRADPDNTPEPPADPVSRMGDVWLLGAHRIICGSSTDEATVSTLLRDRGVDVCLTDPPYGLGGTKSAKNNYDLHEDTREHLVELIAGFLPIAQERARLVVLTPGNANQRLYPDPTWTMAWFTPAGAGSGPWGFCCWQPILCLGRDPKLSNGKGRHPDAIVHTESAEKNGHPCAKPINFWCWLMERVSEPGAEVYEPFSGSGTTIIAAEMTGRRCYAIELSPAYVDVAVRRWQEFTGQDALLDATSQSFSEVAAERGVL